MDVFGKALQDFQAGNTGFTLLSHSSLGETQTLNPEYFFRKHADMPELEKAALQLAKSPILDIGCGAGSHALILQESGHEVTGIDLSAGAIDVAQKQGLRHVLNADIWTFKTGTFKTLLLLMNGAGLAGKLDKLPDFLRHLASLLAHDGQILLDSSDIIYVYESDSDGGVWVPGDMAYYGEVTYQWEYREAIGPEFPWLFVDFNRLKAAALEAGLQAELVQKGTHYDYLARLTKVEK